MKTNFLIHSNLLVSNAFKALKIYDFFQASIFIKNLPYKRNLNKDNILCVLAERNGTCSTKHALLKALAQENKYFDIKLMLGIFSMNPQNTPKIIDVLSKYGLTEMPEAHNYLKIEDEILDYTSKNSKPEDFMNDLICEIEIQPNQITDFKISFHQSFLEKYLKDNPSIPYTLNELWKIREECISALQK